MGPMKNFHLIQIDRSKPLQKAFIAFPKTLYKNHRLYAPFFDQDMKMLLRKKHPFFKHSQGDFFLLQNADKRTIGRIFICENRRYNNFHGTNFAFFDYFDMENDPEAAAFLFERMEQWAQKRGLSGLVGPMLSGGANGAGILIDGFEKLPAMTMMRYNYPYYRELLEDRGFEKYVDLKSFSVDPRGFELQERIRRLGEIAEKRGRFQVLRFSKKKEVLRWADEIKGLYAKTLNHHLEDYPLSAEELDKIADELLLVLDPELIALITYDDQIVGFTFGFADLTPAIIRNRGKLGPLSILRLLYERSHNKKILFNGIGILPRYHGLGGNAILYRELETMVKKRGFTEIEMVQISERTELMLSDAASLGATLHKTHRLYQKNL